MNKLERALSQYLVWVITYLKNRKPQSISTIK